jgi:hemolysin-activating ACP:hemolysin acyltransferase
MIANPLVALGLAVSFLMTMPAFVRLGFGEWSRILVGQINRKHYRLVLDDKNRVVGFVGWAETTKATAEAWVDGHASFSGEDAISGDCIVFNAWAATTPEVNRFLLNGMREVAKDKDTAYFKRTYPDGRVRPVRLSVNEFVAGHLSTAPDL